jgi:GNAT superfamily N-acetyltransferase
MRPPNYSSPVTKLDASKLTIREATAADAPSFAAFTCGTGDGAAELARFLREDAVRLTTLRTAITHVAFYRGELAGFVTLTADAVELQSGERKRLRRGDHRLGHTDPKIVAAIKVARLAVGAAHAASYSGTGTELMRLAVAVALDIADIGAGCRLLTVDSKPEAVGFYARLGFNRSKAAARPDAYHFDVYADPLPAWAI